MVNSGADAKHVEHGYNQNDYSDLETYPASRSQLGPPTRTPIIHGASH